MEPRAFEILVGLALWSVDVARLAVRLVLAGGLFLALVGLFGAL
jgi:hypothetical protein